MELSQHHLDLLRAIAQETNANGIPSTSAVGERLRTVVRERGGKDFVPATAPWHGTNPMADELAAQGLIEVHVGMAEPTRWGSPARTPDSYGLELTEAGREVLRQAP